MSSGSAAVISSSSNRALVSRSLSGGELFERITAEGYVMSEAEVINYMRQICEGVKHMHEKNIIHLGEWRSFGLIRVGRGQTRSQVGEGGTHGSLNEGWSCA